ncbi:hypothetical protein WDL1CHR_00907 [Variovorax sp. WDL1]|nr:hypothetical protein APY03_7611 [Variovorax sp. WDL1]PNG56304.1 hypothetical protein CHC07_02719 [Variovorax sp. B4]PNG57728.1 hypothetical protein CHC06_02722 [Variovorax sp. B2]VTV09842.1 hypothetical protein WDL1CHR_00907 [Variovorax sp. WDL1]
MGLGLLLAACALGAEAAPPDPGTAVALREQHRKLAGQLASSPLRRPVHLESAETHGGLQGDVYAVVDYPLEQVSAALADGSQWCEMLLLHVNNRRCRVGRQPEGETLTLSVVKRYDRPVEQAFELPFVHRVASSSRDYLEVRLSAESGPLGTSNYRVTLAAVPLGERQTFLHFSYAYHHHVIARLATMAYLATFGSHKMGFTVIGKTPNGEPDYIRGLRGLMERNAMRYFLTLDAYLAGLDTPPPERADKRLHRWFEQIEQYPAQLHEIDLATYLELKRSDRRRDAGKP